MKVANTVLDVIGMTPMVRLNRIITGLRQEVLMKLEFLSPSGSLKDRIARHMVEAVERSGQLTKGSVIVEATTGNTGTAFSMVATAKGYRMIVVMPEGMSLVDKVARVSDEDAIEMARRLALEEGIFAGISAGANIRAAMDFGRTLPEGGRIVTLIPDTGMRYLSADLCRSDR